MAENVFWEEDVFKKRWPPILRVVRRLLGQECVPKKEVIDIHHDVYRIVAGDNLGNETLQKALQSEIKEHMSLVKKKILCHEDDFAVLRSYSNEWETYFQLCAVFPHLFKLLELKPSGIGAEMETNTISWECTVIGKMLLSCWREEIFSHVSCQLLQTCLKLIVDERNEETHTGSQIVAVRQSFVYLNANAENPLLLYREQFESAYLQTMNAYYQQKAPRILEDNGVLPYLQYAQDKIHDEHELACRYLETGRGSTSVEVVTQYASDVLVMQRADMILQECLPLLKADDTQKLSLMYNLLNRAGGSPIKEMIKYMENYICQEGLADLSASAGQNVLQDPERYVERLLDLFQRFSDLIKFTFKDDADFLAARERAFCAIVNDTSVFSMCVPDGATRAPARALESRCPELLAVYVDSLLRKCVRAKKLTSDEIDARLRNVLLVLRYVANKDVFMRYHWVHLTRRLIQDLSADADKEETMADWLREIGMPADHVNKFCRMFTDIKLAEDFTKHFKSSCPTNGKTSVCSSIKILNSTAWTRVPKVSVTLPQVLEDAVPVIDDFYRQTHNGRRLAWQHMLSYGTITFQTNEGSYDLEVTTFQMAILFVFNDRRHDVLSFENFELATELPEVEIAKTLFSLTCNPKSKRQVVLVVPHGAQTTVGGPIGIPAREAGIRRPSDLTRQTGFILNLNFCFLGKGGVKQTRGRLKLILKLPLQAEVNSEDSKCIAQLRAYRVQEAINKIMKTRKYILLGKLQTELVEMLKLFFVPSKTLIKEQIEWLIENGYLRRDTKDINKFHYIA